MDWNLLRSFLAVAETGSLTAAARRLGMSQPSIGRHIAELELRLDTQLFHRGPAGQELSDRGHELLQDARRMGEAADAFSRKALGRMPGLGGTVRITASQIIGTLVLPGMVAALQREEPAIEVEIVASDSVGNLMRRDADIAIRMVRPYQLDLVIRHIGDIPLVMAASSSYFARAGRPKSVKDLHAHDLVGYDRSTEIIDGFARAGIKLGRSAFKLRSDDHLVLWEALKAGAGLGFAQAPLVARTDGLESCLVDIKPPPLETYLAMHGDLRHSPRIRRVADFVFEAMHGFAATPLS